MKKFFFIFISKGKKDQMTIPWMKWKKNSKPESMRGWRLKNLPMFSKALAAKGSHGVINGNGFWYNEV